MWMHVREKNNMRKWSSPHVTNFKTFNAWLLKTPKNGLEQLYMITSNYQTFFSLDSGTRGLPFGFKLLLSDTFSEGYPVSSENYYTYLWNETWKHNCHEN